MTLLLSTRASSEQRVTAILAVSISSRQLRAAASLAEQGGGGGGGHDTLCSLQGQLYPTKIGLSYHTNADFLMVTYGMGDIVSKAAQHARPASQQQQQHQRAAQQGATVAPSPTAAPQAAPSPGAKDGAGGEPAPAVEQVGAGNEDPALGKVS